MNKNNRIATAAALTACLISFMNTEAWAALTISDVPLPVASAPVDPNIMLLIDNSGSMFNIVEDLPYNSGLPSFNCPLLSQMPSALNQIHIRIFNNAPGFTNNLIAGGPFILGTNVLSNERCFNDNATYSARLYADSNDRPGSYLPASYTGHYLNWYFNKTSTAPTWTNAPKKPGTFARIEVAQSASNSLLDSLSNVRMGLATYNNGDGALISEGINSIATNRASMKTKINALVPNGNTPLGESLQDIGRYYVEGENNTLDLNPVGSPATTALAYNVFGTRPGGVRPVYGAGVTQASPIQNFCQKNFAVLLTDGRPQGDQNLSGNLLQDYDGDCTILPNLCAGGFDRKLTQTYESAGSDYLNDVALALFDIDLRPDLDDFDGDEVKNNVITYTIGFADTDVLNDPLMQSTADQGGGEFFQAGNAQGLIDAFSNVIQSVNGKTSSTATVAATTGSISSDTTIFQARFNSGDWSGDLRALDIDETNGSVGVQQWSAASNIPAATSRDIFTSTNGSGVAFEWANLDVTQQAALNTVNGVADPVGAEQGQLRLNYLRGDQSQERTNGGAFRNRTSLMGDIVNSSPAYVQAPRLRYPDSLEGPVASTFYSAFRNQYVGRVATLYAGANDGMLHAFDAETGVEKFAYVPNAVYDNLSELTDPAFEHRFFVDGTPNVGDAFFDGAWHTILTGGLNNGGKSVYALDITDPDNFDDSKVLWEFTDPDLGLSFSQPAIVRLENGTWAAVFGNGYNSTNQRAVLFIVNIKTGALISKIDTGVGSAATPNGLATVAAADTDGDNNINYVYAGDLQGNLWKFNVQGGIGSWDVALKQGNTNLPLFVATDALGNPQPITTSPEVARAPNGQRIILFGTGKYLEASDLLAANFSPQSFYGIYDNDNGQVARNQLLQQTVVAETTSSGFNVRVTSNNGPIGTYRGWYIDLPTSGERQVSNAVLRNGRIIFVSIIPSTIACGDGGTSWLMELNATDGSRLAFAPFDLNGDGLFDASDQVLVGGVLVNVSGKQSKDGITSTPAIISDGGGNGSGNSNSKEYKYSAGSSGNVEVTVENPGSTAVGRLSWRQLK